ncbi:hypothetical protein CONLIGDRAFT_520615 [Coniochaeta ligniaria NRRL 30616]|uniref:Uncharacterized protein n=1 Tax=Coniochaeta ligniaria NRRL 30616 TaxID=1408157 RepID=A0A1J7IYH7_9PEZI|nr:hypothetical protein CONLIGDRAFT_520615 [Coniochaeta ligniaria NRRL 30616]
MCSTKAGGLSIRVAANWTEPSIRSSGKLEGGLPSRGPWKAVPIPITPAEHRSIREAYFYRDPLARHLQLLFSELLNRCSLSHGVVTCISDRSSATTILRRNMEAIFLILNSSYVWNFRKLSSQAVSRRLAQTRRRRTVIIMHWHTITSPSPTFGAKQQTVAPTWKAAETKKGFVRRPKVLGRRVRGLKAYKTKAKGEAQTRSCDIAQRRHASADHLWQRQSLG